MYKLHKITKTILLSIITFITLSFGLGGCVANRKVSVVLDSMGSYDAGVITSQIEANGDEVVYYNAQPGATTWTHNNLISQIQSPNNDTIVVSFGLNETRYIRGDADAVPHKTLSQVLSSWTYIKNLAIQHNKCLVWTTTQTAYPLNTQPTIGIIQNLNTWIRANVTPAEWEPTVNYNVQYQGATWVKPEDGFHLRTGSWGPNAFGIKIREAVGTC